MLKFANLFVPNLHENSKVCEMITAADDFVADSLDQ